MRRVATSSARTSDARRRHRRTANLGASPDGGATVIGRRLVSVRGLVVPADPRRRVEMKEAALTSAALSDLIGGGLLDDALYATFDGHRYVIYLDDDRGSLDLPLNDRAATLSARLGVGDRNWLRDLRGDALILGTDEHHNDEDLPRAVLDLARTAGLLPCLEPRFLPPSPQSTR